MSKRFKIQDYFRYKKLGTKWRRPHGLQSKLRVKKGGSGRKPAIGYRTAKKIRYKISGLVPVAVENLPAMAKLGKEHGIILPSSLGLKKIALLEEKAKEMGIRILNRRKLKKLWKRKEQLKNKTSKKEAKKEEKKAETKTENEIKGELKTEENKN